MFFFFSECRALGRSSEWDEKRFVFSLLNISVFRRFLALNALYPLRVDLRHVLKKVPADIKKDADLSFFGSLCSSGPPVRERPASDSHD